MGKLNTSGEERLSKVLFWNVDGLSKTKFTKLKSEFKKYEIIALVETFANRSNEYILEGYTCYASIRKKHILANRNSGGCLIFVKENLNPFVTLLSSNSTDIIWLKLETPNKIPYQKTAIMLLACVYVSPKSSQRVIPLKTFEILREEMLNFENVFPSCTFLLLGDYNARTGLLNDCLSDPHNRNSLPYLNETERNLFGIDQLPHHRSNCDKQINDYGKYLTEMCIEHGLCICNGRIGCDKDVGHFTCYTPRGASLIDYVITSAHFLNEILYFNVLPITPFSIHAQLSFSLKTLMQKRLVERESDPTPVALSTLQPRIKYNIPVAELPQFAVNFKERFDTFNYLEIVDLNPSAVFRNFYNLIYEVAERYKFTYTPFKKNRRYVKEITTDDPFFDHECLLKRQKIDKVQSTIRTLNIQNKDHNLYDDMITENVKTLHEVKQDFKSTLNRKETEYYNKENDELLKAMDTDKGFWDYYKLKCPKQTFSPSEVSPEAWVEHTTTLYSCPEFEVPDLGEASQKDNTSLDCPFTNSELSQQIKKITGKKACGPDGLGGGLLKSCFNTIFLFLCTIFNSLYNASLYPIEWTNSITFMLFKKGQKKDPNNYRSISLLNILSKVFSGILHNRLMVWCTKENIFSNFQFGFRPNHSTIDSIFIHSTLIESQLSKKQKKLYTCYIDFTKAFDTVIWEILWKKLTKLGISEDGKFLKMLKAIYAKVTAQIITPFGLTPKITLFKGLRQGCILSPLLFILFINDIKDYLSQTNGHEMFIGNFSISHLLFADDLVIFSQSIIGLQRYLDTLDQYCKTFKLNINLSKTFIVVYRKGGKPAKAEKWHIDKVPIKTVPHFKYLGIIFSTTLSWTKAQSDLAGRARKAMFLIKKFVGITKIRNPSILFKIFDSCVLPILNYGSEVWGFHEGKNVDKVYHDFCKFVAGLPTTTPNIAARGEFGRKRLITYRYNRIIKYWSKLLENNCNEILRASYQEQLRLDSLGKNVWVSDVRTILCSMGFSQIWYNQSIPDPKTFFKDFKNQLMHLELNLFDLQKNHYNRLFLFSQIKSFDTSHHWLSNEPFHLKALYSRFICSAHNLAIETGRRLQTPRYLRTCILCDHNEVEDEFHFMMVCPLYNDFRARYIPVQYRTNPNWNKFISLLINPANNKSVMSYLRSAFHKRDKTIEAILYS